MNLLFRFVRLDPGDSLDQEAIKRALREIAIERVGGLLELLPVKQALNVAGDRVRGHDQGRVERVDVFAGDGALGVADQGRDRHLGEAEIVADAREAVSQDVGRDIGERRVLEDLLPVVRETAERVVVAIAGEDICAGGCLPTRFEKLDNRQADRTDRGALLAVDQPQAAPIGICFGPHQADHFAPAAASQRDLTNDIHGRRVLLIFLGCAQHLAQRPILRFREPAGADVVLRLPQAVGRIGGDDASFDRIGEDAAEEPDGSRGRSGAAADDRLAAQLLRLDGNSRLAGHDVLQDLVDVGLG